MRFAINGFGRVGRTLLRVYASREDARAKLTLAAINEIADADTVLLESPSVVVVAERPMVIVDEPRMCVQLSLKTLTLTVVSLTSAFCCVAVAMYLSIWDAIAIFTNVSSDSLAFLKNVRAES